MKKPDTTATNRQIGDYYELYTAKKLKESGMALLCHSYRRHPHEIDLIMMDGTDIVFVEVKARLEDDPSVPELSADARKMKNTFLAAAAYIADIMQTGADADAFGYRFDLAAIVRDRQHNVKEFSYYKNYYEAQHNEILRFALRYRGGSV